MDILIFNVYKTVRSMTKTNKQHLQLHNLKNPNNFKICIIFNFSHRLKILMFSFRRNSCLVQPSIIIIIIKYRDGRSTTLVTFYLHFFTKVQHAVFQWWIVRIVVVCSTLPYIAIAPILQQSSENFLILSCLFCSIGPHVNICLYLLCCHPS